MKYPLPKLDQVAFPSTGASGMENWGSHPLQRHRAALRPGDQLASDEGARLRGGRARDRAPVVWRSRDDGVVGQSLAERRLRVVDGHEGDGPFQSRLADVAARRGRARNGRCASMRARPRIRSSSRVANEAQANDAFDEITYSKGQSFIRMLESWLGEEPFRDGIRALHASARLRQHHDRRPVAGARRKLGQAGARIRRGLDGAAGISAGEDGEARAEPLRSFAGALHRASGSAQAFAVEDSDDARRGFIGDEPIAHRRNGGDVPEWRG